MASRDTDSEKEEFVEFAIWIARRSVQRGVDTLSAVWPSLKLIGERRFLLLRFRPRTVLSLVRNPEHALESASLPVLAGRHQCLSRINEL